MLVWFVIVLLAGCASQKDVPTQSHYLALLPENADIYLRFPVQGNKGLSMALVAAVAPSTEEKDIERVADRFSMIYGAVKDREFSAVASGFFPKIGVGLALNKKSGWTVTKDKSIPVTGKYYQYGNSPLQIAFPNSSTMVAAPQVSSMLDSFQQLGSLAPTPGQSRILSRFQEEIPSSKAIDFYMADVMDSLVPFMKLGISLPVKDMYGSFTPTSSFSEDGSSFYSFDGYLGVPDSRAMKAALVALRILARTTGMNFSASAQEGDSVIHISGISISQDSLAEFVSRVVQ